jgi:hypothetical protein
MQKNAQAWWKLWRTGGALQMGRQSRLSPLLQISALLLLWAIAAGAAPTNLPRRSGDSREY